MPCDNHHSVKPIRSFFLSLALVAIAAPAWASSITVLVGDKDWFGAPLLAGTTTPWTGNPNDGITDLRSGAEAGASNGAQLTDLYSALFFNYGACNPATDAGCSPNKDTATVLFPFIGTLNSGAITIRMGDFQCATWGAMTVDINGVGINFCFDDGVQGVQTRTFSLTAPMIAAANAVGAVRLNLDHRGAYSDPDNGIVGYGSLGKAVAGIARAFGFRVEFANRPGGAPAEGRRGRRRDAIRSRRRRRPASGRDR